MPKVLNAREVGTSHPNAIYCGRPSKYGNPFKVGEDGNRTEVIAKHKQWFLQNHELIKDAKRELAGKDLICWCAPQPCHCDVIISIANEPDLSGFF